MTAKRTTSTISRSARRQFRSSVRGSSTRRVTKVSRCSRKNASQSPNRWSAPCSITFSRRPEWMSPWKARGRASTCSKKRCMAPSRLRWARRSAKSATRMFATIPVSPTTPQRVRRRTVSCQTSPAGRPAMPARTSTTLPNRTGSAKWRPASARLASASVTARPRSGVSRASTRRYTFRNSMALPQRPKSRSRNDSMAPGVWRMRKSRLASTLLRKSGRSLSSRSRSKVTR